MYKTLRMDALTRVLHHKTLWVVFCWIIGLLTGTVLAAGADPYSFSLMRQTVSCQVSIVDLFIAAAFPFLLAAYAVFIDRPKLLLLICGCKAFSFAFCAYTAAASFGTAGWLVQPIVQFTDICMVPVLCWFCIRHITGSADSLKKDMLVCMVFAAAVASIDYLVVAPFLAKLIDI